MLPSGQSKGAKACQNLQEDCFVQRTVCGVQEDLWTSAEVAKVYFQGTLYPYLKYSLQKMKAVAYELKKSASL